MASKTEICNLALSHLGIGSEISNIETEHSQEATACKRFYETAKDATLREFSWPFATKLVTLGLVEEEPNSEWAYSYRYPTNAIKLKRILSGIRNDTRQSRVPYRLSKDDTGILILTDKENAEVEFIERVDNPQFYPSDFTMALSYKLAYLVAPRLTGGDPFKLKQQVAQLYQIEIAMAMNTAASEEQDEELPESEFIRMRE